MAKLTQKIRTARHNPRLVPRIAINRLRSVLSYELSGLLNEWSAPPETVNIYPTARCNLKCAMCFVHFYRAGPELELDDWLKVVEQVAAFKPRVHLSGGEPCLHPGIMDIIRRIKDRGLYAHLTTNGTHLASQARDLVDLGLNQLDVSIDGPPEIHDRIRGKAGTYRLIDEGLGKLGRLRAGTGLPLIRINSIINFGDLQAMVQLVEQAGRWGAQTVQFIYPLYLKPEEVARHADWLRAGLGRDLNYWKYAAHYDAAPDDPDRAWQTVQELRARAHGGRVRIEIFPDFSFPQFRAYYDRAADFYGSYSGSCRAMWNTLTILPNGEVESCPDYVTGSCRQDLLKIAWNGRAMKDLRRRIRDGNFFPVCRACCFFY